MSVFNVFSLGRVFFSTEAIAKLK